MRRLHLPRLHLPRLDLRRLHRLVLALVVLAAPAAAQDGGALIVYSAQHASLTKAWADGFTAQTGIEVTVRKGSDMVMANQIVQEAENSPADVFLTENSPAITLVEQAGLLAPLEAATLAQVPESFRPESGLWTGIAARATVFAYNTDLLKEADLPKSMLDLAAPEWKGRWGVAPAGPDFQAIVSALLELRGPEETAGWLAGLRDNALIYRGNFEAMRGANAGEVAGSLIYHYYFFGDRNSTGESSDKVALHYFGNKDPGAFVSISGGGVLKSSTRAKAAQAFVAYVTGPQGQAVLRDGTSFEYPVGSGIEANAAMKPLGDLDFPAIDPSLLNASKVVVLLTASGVL